VALSALALMSAPGLASAKDAVGPPPQAFFTLPEPHTQEAHRLETEWNYTFLRSHHMERVLNETQTAIGTRRQRRKSHVITWRAEHGLTDRLQAEAELTYLAYRQHTHSDGDEHDRNDDGDFDRALLGVSYQALQERDRVPDLRVRAGALLPNRAERESIGQEAGFDLEATAGRHLGPSYLAGSLGFSMTFDNHDHPADPIFADTPISKGHDLRALRYGLGVVRPMAAHWQANLELDGSVGDRISLNQRMSESRLSLTPGVVYTAETGRSRYWIGVGAPLGLTHDTDHLGVAIRLGGEF
jgi:hypothetical protein